MVKHNKPPTEPLPQGNETGMDPRYASKQDINDLKELLTKFAQGPAQPATMEKQVEKDAELPDINPVPAKYRLLVDEILGPQFGINVVYPDKGSGFLFKVIVPLELSNASSSHKEFYKADVRTKAIGYEKGIEGVREYLERVARNLKINLKK